MFGLGKKKAKGPLDFEITFDDGRTFTSADGTWDEVCRDCRIAKLVIGGEVLEGFERYAFSWEAEARATVGLGGKLSRADTHGVIVAVIGAAISGETARIVRVPRDPKKPRINQDFPVKRVAFADHVWRRGIVPVTPTIVVT